MRKLPIIGATGLLSLALLGQLSPGASVGSIEDDLGEIEIVKTINGALPDDTADWEFTITSDTCGAAIFRSEAEYVAEETVTIPAAGGMASVLVVPDDLFFAGVATPCEYTVTETAVDGWTTDPSSYPGITVASRDTTTVSFRNTPPPTTVPPTTAPPTTAAPTTAPPTTAAPTTAATTTTTPATTVAPTTTAGDISPVLPETGASDSTRDLALVASLLLSTGLAAVLVTRRRSLV